MSRIALFVCLLAAGQVAPAGSVGFRLIPVPDGRPGRLHVWYPAESCTAPMKYIDYLTLPGAPPGDLSRELRMGFQSEGLAITDAGWEQVVSAPLKACRDAPASSGRRPAILAIQLPGAWPVAAERFARSGYVFAAIERMPTRPPAGDMPGRIAARMVDFIGDLETAVAMLEASGLADVGRIGLIGQNHALLMFAMGNARIRAVALQDSAFQAGADADAAARTGRWRPDQFSAPLLYAIPEARIVSEDLWSAFVKSSPTPWTRIAMRAPSSGHSDVTTDGYLVRTRLPGAAAGSPLTKTFLALLEIQVGFMDEHVKGLRPARVPIDPALFRVERK